MALSGWVIFLILLVLAVVLGAGGYIAYTHYRANRLGLPPPSLNPFNRHPRAPDPTTYRAPAPAPGGIRGWIADTWHGIRNPRSATGAYESHATSSRTPYGSGGRRGFGPLDPDEAWDARVQDEGGVGAYYEEQELGDGPYGGGGYGSGGGLDERYDEAMHGEARGRVNPFGEQAEEISVRSVSPRPYVETGKAGGRGAHHQRGQSSLGTTAGSATDESPTERRSMFREDV